jgi:hypothetical protein
MGESVDEVETGVGILEGMEVVLGVVEEEGLSLLSNILLRKCREKRNKNQ